jgi:hypothetical protein
MPFIGGRMRHVRVAAVTVLLAFGLLAAGPLPTAAAKTGTGCPAGFQLRTVESLAATGNTPNPGLLDAAGNNDGLVCVLPLPDAFCTAMGYDPCPVETVYLFLDNTVPVG